MTKLRTLDIGATCRIPNRDGAWIITTLKGRLNDRMRRGRLGVAPLHPILVNIDTDPGVTLVVAGSEEVTPL